MIFRAKLLINWPLLYASLALGLLVICHQAEAAQYYHGMLVQASRACLHKDVQAKKHWLKLREMGIIPQSKPMQPTGSVNLNLAKPHPG
jgi:hypothetical protein